MLRAARLRWKRLRRSVKHQRDEAGFRRAQAALKDWGEQLRRGTCEFELWYYDEAGFSLSACIPYAWQTVGERIELESRGNQGKRQNVLGFMRWDAEDFYLAAFEGSIDNHLVAGCFRRFAAAKKGEKPKLYQFKKEKAYNEWMNYQAEIKETVEELRQLEKETKDLKGRDRVRFLRLLKIGAASSQKQAGNLIGIKIRQSQRLWQRYQAVVVEEFIKNQYAGRRSKLGVNEKKILEERLKKDDVMSLQQAQEYLAKEFGVAYTIG